ncbi:hypothetical protein HYPSUDRAFT_53029 [Hypholoma sublateritium FD-334 SS-4]|uniref:MSP domain-containing protein n=1 Tax=Hypholoma sublateritium (strain FD-334 SS-4) TaxID=945553 RepID=A0A0D2LDH1_HYPSF|nr:hypothetical protein HYPSUDRAFT_53029 [Hypholoma sublateritium FD-334 SS-4]
MTGVPNVEMHWLPPAETERATDDVSQGLPEAQADLPSELEPPANRTSPSTARSGQGFRVDFHPDGTFYFQRLLSRTTSGSLRISNPNAYPVTFKLKTTHPQTWYHFLSNESHGLVENAPLPEEPPLHKRCSHKILVEIYAIISEEDDLPQNNALDSSRRHTPARFYTFNVVYIPAEGLKQAEMSKYAAGTADTFCDEQEGLVDTATHSLSKHALIVGNAEPSSGSVEEKALEILEREVHQMSCKKMGVSFYPTDTLLFRIEKRPLEKEPPPEETCKDQFQVEITTIAFERDRQVPASDVCENPTDKNPGEFYKFNVKYIPALADGFASDDLAEYEAGMAPPIPEELFDIYPNTHLCFKRPLRNPLNLKKHITITNLFTRPMAFMTLVTAQNAQWAAANSNKQTIFHKKLPVLFIAQNGLTLEEEVIKARQGLLDHLRDMEMLEEVGRSNLPRRGEANEGDTYLKQPTKAQETFIRGWLLSVAPNMIPE